MSHVPNAGRTAAFAGLLLWLCLMALAGAVTGALAHGGYSPICCSDRDCTPIDPKHVVETDEGFTVTLGPNDHPMMKVSGATEPQTWFIPRKEAQKAIDFDFHACISPTGRLLCFYPRGNGA